MGVSGSGKSSVGELLANRAGYDFLDGDSFHPSANVEKMSQGTPLTDADRAPWLAILRQKIEESLAAGRGVVLACSALKARYREVLAGSTPNQVRFVHLKGSFELIQSRMTSRADHFMKSGMLRSQFEALEEPLDALVMDISDKPHEIVDAILEAESANF